uniref:Putative ovule protein n=1 Tax=Solanum chacoense TaxID=4108 RepID=A0A0V0H0R7_SOLCH
MFYMEAKGPQMQGKTSNISGASLILQQQHTQCDTTSGVWGGWGVHRPYPYLFASFILCRKNSILLG